MICVPPFRLTTHARTHTRNTHHTCPHSFEVPPWTASLSKSKKNNSRLVLSLPHNKGARRVSPATSSPHTPTTRNLWLNSWGLELRVPLIKSVVGFDLSE